MTPFFSIIIPLYNCGNTLKATLNSIAGQRFKNYELVLVDGRSADDTLQIISIFSNLYPAITVKIISEPDQGIYDAMNKGIDMAEGEWVSFMGGDDTFYSDNVLSDVYEAVEQDNTDLIYGNVWGAVSKIKYVDDTLSKVLSRGIHHQGIFYKRYLFGFTGKYNLNFKIAADYHLTLKVFFNQKFKTKYINKDITNFGEAGLSSNNYDYRFYSYHYKFLAVNSAVDKIDDALKCLETSVYCCLYLARQKKHMGFAWKNMVYYVFKPNKLNLPDRFKTLLRMAYWSVKPA